MFFKNNSTSLQILDDWILVTKENNKLYKQKKIPLTKTWDQAILKKVIKIKDIVTMCIIFLLNMPVFLIILTALQTHG